MEAKPMPEYLEDILKGIDAQTISFSREELYFKDIANWIKRTDKSGYNLTLTLPWESDMYVKKFNEFLKPKGLELKKTGQVKCDPLLMAAKEAAISEFINREKDLPGFSKYLNILESFIKIVNDSDSKAGEEIFYQYRLEILSGKK